MGYMDPYDLMKCMTNIIIIYYNIILRRYKIYIYIMCIMFGAAVRTESQHEYYNNNIHQTSLVISIPT